MAETLHGIVLFSGGLDSLLTARLLMEQGQTVRCLHFFSPFFGSAEAVPRWQRQYGLDVEAVDVSLDVVALLRDWPAHGFGQVLNPCVDCKIRQLRAARRYMERVGARFLATGEVLGQRPMSQRRDTLFGIVRDAQVADVLVRPLSAQHLPPTPVERAGLVDRSRLLGITGRGRTEQLALARHFGLEDIPTPGGGCRLTEREVARRYWMVLTHVPHPEPMDFALANAGRQGWHITADGVCWLCVGRHSADTAALMAAQRPEDALLRLRDMSGPLALARHGSQWPDSLLAQAAAHMASWAPRAREAGGSVTVRVERAGDWRDLSVLPQRCPHIWQEPPSWETIKPLLRAEARQRQEAQRAARQVQHAETLGRGVVSPGGKGERRAWTQDGDVQGIGCKKR